MPNNTIKHGDDTLALYFLAWQDVIERLDTIILEIRHIQQNIIHLLHVPELYDPLKHEENYLWKYDRWGNKAEKRKNKKQLVKSVLIDYPPISKEATSAEGGAFNNELREADKIFKEIKSIVQDCVDYDLWSVDQKARYHNLTALQTLKQNVFNDKLVLCEIACPLFSHIIQKGQSATDRKYDLANFIFTRTAIMARTREYINRLGDLQTNFSHSQDFGLHDHPRPNINRRRDQHMYGVHLNNRCRDINREMLLLLTELKVCDYDKHTTVFHRWQKDFTSHSHTFYDNLSDETKIAHHNINTSFWMPERPDLQPVIAHEVAHGIVHERLGNLDKNELDKDDYPCPFVIMVKKLMYCVDCIEETLPSDYPMPVHEIIVDILAATIEGPSYLYALFLEIIGFGMEEIVKTSKGNNYIDLEQIPYIGGALGDPQLVRDWYYRISIVCVWLENVYPEIDDKFLCDRLIKACRQTIEDLQDFIECNSAPDHKHGAFWKAFTKQLCNVIEKESSSTITLVKQWLSKRAEEEEPGSKHTLLRSSIGLQSEVREFLAEGLWHKKINRYLCEENVQQDLFEKLIEKQIPNIYGFTYKESSKVLFRNLQDVPWQSALLRGLDFISGDKKNGFFSPKNAMNRNKSQSFSSALLFEMHHKMSLGRDLYQIALDFDVHTQEHPFLRLAEAIGMLNKWVKRSENCSQELKGDIKNWIEKESNLDYQGAIELAKDCPDDGQGVDQYSARSIKLLQQYSPESGEHTRLIGRLAGHKLNRLYLSLLRKAKKKQDFPPELISLVDFLGMRSTEKKPEQRRSLIEAFNSRHSSTNNKGVSKYQPIDLHMFSRICYSGGYTYPNPTPNSSYKNKRFNWSLVSDHWSDIDEEITTRYQHVIGRYDATSITPTRPMHRCKYPKSCSVTDDNSKLSFFTRRELVIPVRLGEKSWNEVYVEPTNLSAPYSGILAITLKRPGSRLDFISRLLKVVKNNKELQGDKNKEPKYLHELTPVHLGDSNNDRAYLSDSWADILLVFGTLTEKIRLKEIFQTQSVIFEDFQVDRTELILTPDFFDYAAEDLKTFSVSISVRLLEDRTLSCANKEFVKALKDKADKIIIDPETGLTFCKCLCITRTPGRMDFTIHINPEYIEKVQNWTKIRNEQKNNSEILLRLYGELAQDLNQKENEGQTLDLLDAQKKSFNAFIAANQLEDILDKSEGVIKLIVTDKCKNKIDEFMLKNPRGLHQAFIDCIPYKETDRVQTKVSIIE